MFGFGTKVEKKPKYNGWDIKNKLFWTEGWGSMALAVLAALTIRWLLLEAYVIPSGSMFPSLLKNDHIFVNKLTYGIRAPFSENWLVKFREPERGEVIAHGIACLARITALERCNDGAVLLKRGIGLARPRHHEIAAAVDLCFGNFDGPPQAGQAADVSDVAMEIIIALDRLHVLFPC